MKKIFFSLILLLLLLNTQAQTQRKISANLITQFNTTLYDVTTQYNSGSIGAGLQLFYNNKTKFKPTVECSIDVYLGHSDVAIFGPDGKLMDGVENMKTIFGGIAYQPSRIIYLSLTTGPSFINGKTLLGIKPSVGFYFTQQQRGTFRISWINIFDRYSLTKKDFGSISFALGFKFF